MKAGLLSVRSGLPFELHIYIEAAEEMRGPIASAKARSLYAKSPQRIDYWPAAIFCGYCVIEEPLPETDAIARGHGFELATISYAGNLGYRKREQMSKLRPQRPGFGAIWGPTRSSTTAASRRGRAGVAGAGPKAFKFLHRESTPPVPSGPAFCA